MSAHLSPPSSTPLVALGVGLPLAVRRVPQRRAVAVFGRSLAAVALAALAACAHQPGGATSAEAVAARAYMPDPPGQIPALAPGGPTLEQTLDLVGAPHTEALRERLIGLGFEHDTRLGKYVRGDRRFWYRGVLIDTAIIVFEQGRGALPFGWTPALLDKHRGSPARLPMVERVVHVWKSSHKVIVGPYAVTISYKRKGPYRLGISLDDEARATATARAERAAVDTATIRTSKGVVRLPALPGRVAHIPGFATGADMVAMVGMAVTPAIFDQLKARGYAPTATMAAKKGVGLKISEGIVEQVSVSVSGRVALPFGWQRNLLERDWRSPDRWRGVEKVVRKHPKKVVVLVGPYRVTVSQSRHRPVITSLTLELHGEERQRALARAREQLEMKAASSTAWPTPAMLLATLGRHVDDAPVRALVRVFDGASKVSEIEQYGLEMRLEDGWVKTLVVSSSYRGPLPLGLTPQMGFTRSAVEGVATGSLDWVGSTKTRSSLRFDGPNVEYEAQLIRKGTFKLIEFYLRRMHALPPPERLPSVRLSVADLLALASAPPTGALAEQLHVTRGPLGRLRYAARGVVVDYERGIWKGTRLSEAWAGPLPLGIKPRVSRAALKKQLDRLAAVYEENAAHSGRLFADPDGAAKRPHHLAVSHEDGRVRRVVLAPGRVPVEVRSAEARELAAAAQKAKAEAEAKARLEAARAEGEQVFAALSQDPFAVVAHILTEGAGSPLAEHLVHEGWMARSGKDPLHLLRSSEHRNKGPLARLAGTFTDDAFIPADGVLGLRNGHPLRALAPEVIPAETRTYSGDTVVFATMPSGLYLQAWLDKDGTLYSYDVKLGEARAAASAFDRENARVAASIQSWEHLMGRQVGKFRCQGDQRDNLLHGTCTDGKLTIKGPMLAPDYRLHGYGTKILVDGSRRLEQAGTWSNGKLHGPSGSYSLASPELRVTYRGDFRNGQAHGRGELVFSSRGIEKRYEGQMAKGFPDGSGVYVVKSGGKRFTWEGGMKRGCIAGSGTLSMAGGPSVRRTVRCGELSGMEKMPPIE